jgi:hypothetical protein
MLAIAGLAAVCDKWRRRPGEADPSLAMVAGLN